ncbi:DUF4331 domain-containing protein [Nocardioides sp. CPCC 206349]
MLLATGGLLATSGIAGLGPTGASASSHREAPLISGAPQYDNTDVYAFVSPDDKDSVTLIANWIPFEEPAGGPNFYPFAKDARYNIKIDNDGDARPDIVYTWKFADHYRSRDTFLYNTGQVTSLDDPDLNFRQTYTLTRWQKGHTKTLASGVPVAPSYVGKASMPDYESLRDAAITKVRGGQSFAGQAEDPFFLDLRVFDLLYGGDLSEVGDDTLAGFGVNAVALQVDKDMLTRGKDPVIGIWSTTDRKDSRGHYRQVSRLGMPLVNEVVVPVGKKDRFNASVPRDDAQFGEHVTDPELARLIEAVYGIKAPATPRNDLVQVFLTGVPGLNQPKHVRPSEQLRLNTSIPPTADPDRLGVIGGDKGGFPNGRRLTDDVVDISLQVVEGELTGSPNDLGDAVNQNDVAFGKDFPYLAVPTSGSDTTPHSRTAGFTSLTGGAAPDGPTATADWVPSLAAGMTGAGLLFVLAGAVVLVRRPRPVAA